MLNSYNHHAHAINQSVATGHLISWTINSYSGGSHVEQLSNPSSFGADGANASFDSHFVAICAAILEGGMCVDMTSVYQCQHLAWSCVGAPALKLFLGFAHVRCILGGCSIAI